MLPGSTGRSVGMMPTTRNEQTLGTMSAVMSQQGALRAPRGVLCTLRQFLSPTDAMDALRSLAAVPPAQTCARCGRRAPGATASPTHSHAQARRSASLRRARLCVTRSSGGKDFDVSQPSEFFESPIVMQESTELFRSFQSLSSMQTRYFSFDSEGKRLYLDEMDKFTERLKIFTMRYSLSDDPVARESLRRLNAQLLEAGMTLTSLQERLAQTVTAMRATLEQEMARGISAAPPGESRSAVQGGPFGAGGMPDLGKLMADPEIAEALSDPRVMGILQKVLQNPSTISDYADDPKVKKLILAMFKNQQP